MLKPLVVANWKMNGSSDANASLVASLLEALPVPCDVALCPTFVHLAQVGSLVAGSSIGLGGQDVSEHQAGAYTGEVAAEMLADIGCKFVIIGHSERRQYHGERDEDVAKKFKAVVDAGLTPILCVGETLQEREAGQALAVIDRQLEAVLSQVDLADTVIAYEPVWAIGTGKTATAAQAQDVHAHIRSKIGGAKTRILYGGSVKPENAAALFEQNDIDGALVGGASLVANDFIAICRATA